MNNNNVFKWSKSYTKDEWHQFTRDLISICKSEPKEFRKEVKARLVLWRKHTRMLMLTDKVDCPRNRSIKFIDAYVNDESICDAYVYADDAEKGWKIEIEGNRIKVYEDDNVAANLTWKIEFVPIDTPSSVVEAIEDIDHD